MEWWINAVIAVFGYLLGMAFAGSFLGRKWMGLVDVTLHKLLKRKITIGKYLYWKHFCGIDEPPRPQNIKKPKSLSEMLLSKFV